MSPAAVTLGGDNDTGGAYEPEIKEVLIGQIRQSGLPFIYEDDLVRNVDERMNVYRGMTGKGKISAFINIGGSYANMGTSHLALRIRPGLNRRLDLPDEDSRGVIFKMSSGGIPVIHLLYMKGLVSEHGIRG